MSTQRSENGRALADMLAKPAGMSDEASAIHERLAAREVVAAADGVTIVFDGRGEALRVHIEPEVVDPTDVASLEQRVLDALNAGRSTAAEAAREALQPLTDLLDEIRVRATQ